MVSIILIGLLLCLCLCWLVKKIWVRFWYWSHQNVPSVPLKFPYFFGNISKGKHLALQFADFYKNHRTDAPFIGCFNMLLKPFVLVVKPELVRSILIENFSNFRDRGLYYNESLEPLSAILGLLGHEEWKQIRPALTPAFTSAKMKKMFPVMKKVGIELVDGLAKIVSNESQVEIRNLFGRFTTDVIGTVAIGIRCQSLSQKRKLQEMAQKAMQPHSKFPWNILASASPRLAKFFRVRKHPKDVSDFFLDIFKQTIAERQQEQRENPNDYMQLLINAGLTTNQIAALAFDFLSAGYADSTSTLSYCLYELSLCENKGIQDKARDEIQTVLEQYDGELTYEALNQMNYCKLIIEEILRKHPVAGNITRIATEPFEVPGTGFTIPKGMRVYIPIYAMHHDEKLFPHPEMVIPERFAVENNIPAGAFMPFGDGPRRCVGSQFAKLLISTALVSLLRNFEFSTCEKTQIPVEYSATKNTLIPSDGVWLNVQRI